MDWAEQVGRPSEVFQGQLEEEIFAALTLRDFFANRGIVGRASLDGTLKNGWVGRETRDRQILDVVLESARVQMVTRDVIEPDALAQVVEQLSRFHAVTSGIRTQPPSPHAEPIPTCWKFS